MAKYSDIASGGGMDPRKQPPAEAPPDQTFAEWLATEMPRGTVIGDPAWWADRIARQYAKRSSTTAEAHCATCACVPGMTPAVRFDTTPAEREGVVRDHLIRMGWTPPSAPVGVEAVRYDAGLLSDYGGGNVEWWHDYIRAELERAHDFYTDALAQQPAAVECPHRTRCDCLVACKYGFAGDGALAAQPGGSDND